MTSYELSLKFGIPVSKIEEIWRYLGIDLEHDGVENADKDFEQVVNTLRRKRISAYALSYLIDQADEYQFKFLTEMDNKILEEYNSANPSGIADDLISDAADTILNYWKDHNLFKLSTFIKDMISRAGMPVNYNYLAVRLLLSLPVPERKKATKTCVTIINKLRHHGHLDGWFERQGAEIIYRKNKTNWPDWCKPENIEKFIKRLSDNGECSTVKLSGYIAYTETINIDEATRILKNREDIQRYRKGDMWTIKETFNL